MHKSLAKYYLITPDYENNLRDYLLALEQSLKNGVRMVQLRSKNLPIAQYEQLAKEICRRVHDYNGILLLNAPENLLNDVAADGIHLSSNRLTTFSPDIRKQLKLVSAACHNEAELKYAQQLQVDCIILSPVLATQSHPNATPLGWENFSKLAQSVELPVYALGGLQPYNLLTAQNHFAYGIAAKRSLWNLDNQLP